MRFHATCAPLTDDLTFSLRYEIHSAVFLFKAHASGAISSEKHVQTVALMRRFINVLDTAATGADHIAAKYAKLLNGLWFHTTRQRNPTDIARSDDGIQDMNPPQPFSDGTEDADPSRLSSFDEIGLQPLDWIESVEGLFSMPVAFPWDPPIF